MFVFQKYFYPNFYILHFILVGISNIFLSDKKSYPDFFIQNFVCIRNKFFIRSFFLIYNFKSKLFLFKKFVFIRKFIIIRKFVIIGIFLSKIFKFKIFGIKYAINGGYKRQHLDIYDIFTEDFSPKTQSKHTNISYSV